MNPRAPVPCLALALALALLTPRAFAQDPRASEARREFERGVALSAQDRWSEALDAFRRSRAALERPRTVYNLGVALQHVGRVVDAIAALEACLALPETAAEPTLVRDARTLLGALRRAVATLLLVVAPPDAELRVDGVPRATRGGVRTVALDPGTHVLQLSAEGLIAQDLPVTVAAGERVVRRVDLATQAARLHVRVDVPGAVVSLDGEAIGRGTVRWSGPPGPHRLRVEAPGYHDFQRSFVAPAGGRVELVATLDRARGSVFTHPVVLGVAGAVLAATALAVILFVPLPRDPDGGTTGQILQGVTVSW